MTKPERKRGETSPARRAATLVLQRVATGGAFAAPTLDAEIKRANLTERDARLASEIVYGALRVLPELDATLDVHLSRGRPEAYTWAALRAATYQSRHLGRVPDFAIVQETVSLVRHKRGPGLAKLANAVLRKVVAARPSDPEPPRRLALPAWLTAELQQGLGESRAEQFVVSPESAVPLGVRPGAGVESGVLAEQLREALPRARVEQSPLLPGSLRVRGGGDPRRWPGYQAGAFSVQDEGAQAIAALLQVQPGDRVWDACAGRGGKTMQLLQAVGDAGHVVATDLYPEKLEQIPAERARLGLAATVQCNAVDLSVGTGALEGGFDRVLVDAPCTGLGTIRRRPEVLLRVGAEDPARMASLQISLLERALKLVKPGGRLVFATCSATRAEGPGVASDLEAAHPSLVRVTPDTEVPGLHSDPDGIFRLGPWLADGLGPPDTYQVVCWDCP